MDKVFSLYSLHNIFNESLKRQEPTLAFEVTNGNGRFLFMMFFDEEDKESKDLLFLYFKNTRRMLKLKLYGNHSKGQFSVYIKPFMERWFKEELGIENPNSENPFDFDMFFKNLNLSIPNELSLPSKINTLRDSWIEIEGQLPKEIVDENDKIYLKQLLPLPSNKKPQEKTLRKLYLYTEANAQDIAELIENLKRMNTTISWTNDEKYKNNDLFSKVSR